MFFYGAEALAEGVPRSFLGVPHIIDEDGQPDLLVNEYMLARRNGDWVGPLRLGGLHAEVEGRRPLRAKVNYLRTRAYQLDAFRRWCRVEGVRTVAVQEQQVAQYAEELEEGLVTDFEGGILPQSVNQHLGAIIDYLQFATSRGWRDRVGLTVVRSLRGRRGRHEASSGFAIMRRANPAEINIWYTEEEIASFIEEFETAPGKLSAKILYATGMRIGELLRLNVAEIPTSEQFRADRAKRKVRVRGKFDKDRLVPLTEVLIQEIHKFIGFERRRHAARLDIPTDLLIIASSSNGKSAPMKPRALQKEFVRAREASKKSTLTPHLLRHHFAAHFLLRSWRLRQVDRSTPMSFGVSTAENVLAHDLLILKQTLGHTSLDTTSRYLHAISYLSGSEIPDAYSSELLEED